MITKILILLAIVTVIAVIVSIIGSAKGEIVVEEKEAVLPMTEPTTTADMLGDSMATLSDRAIAATQYQMLEDSFKRNCSEDDMTEDVKKTFNHLASHLATIGTKVDPNEVLTPVKEGVPPGWDLN
jgi:hypothetical protein